MPKVITCPHCRTAMQVPDNAAGKNVRCPNNNCKQLFAVPAAAGAAAPQPAAAVAVAAGAPAAAPSGNGASKSAAAAPAPASEPTQCPACGSKWAPGAIACMDCGYLLPSEHEAPEPERP